MEFEVSSCSVKWELNFPSYHSVPVWFRNQKFQFGNTELSLLCRWTPREIYLGYSDKSDITNNFPTEPSRVTVQVENRVTGQIIPSLTVTMPSPPQSSFLWMKKISDIVQAYPDFAICYQLMFIVTFQSQQSETRADEKCVQTPLLIDPVPCSESLSEDLAKLLELDSDSNPDVEFQCGGQSTRAHSLVVSARSPELARMVQSQMVEGATTILKIEDIDPNTLKHFVRYLYTGRLDEVPTSEAAMLLYEAARKFQVQSLARKCVHVLTETLTEENAFDVLVGANRHSDSELMEEVIVFILEKRMPSTSQYWEAFCSSHPLLAMEVQNRYIEELIGSLRN